MAADSSAKPTRDINRQYPRFPIDIPVGITLTRHGAKVECSGRASELSERGIASYIFMDLAIGDRLFVEMTLPYSHEVIYLDAVIRNRTGFRYGLEFKELNPRHKQLLARTCSALSVL